MNPRIFREYDIRGLVDKDLTDEVVRLIGRGFATCLSRQGKRRVVVGRDGRLSSPRFRDPLVQGMVKGGLEVVDVGVCPTPVFYFSLFHLDREGGIMITGSHNPPEFNGFKVCVGKETSMGSRSKTFARLMKSKNFVEGQGSVSFQEMIPAIKILFSKHPAEEKTKSDRGQRQRHRRRCSSQDFKGPGLRGDRTLF